MRRTWKAQPSDDTSDLFTALTESQQSMANPKITSIVPMQPAEVAKMFGMRALFDAISIPVDPEMEQIAKMERGILPLSKEIQETQLKFPRLRMDKTCEFRFDLTEGEEEWFRMKEFYGTVLHYYKGHAHWAGDKWPICWARYGAYGPDEHCMQPQNESCEACGKNKLGTAVDDKGNPSDGKACPDMMYMYVLVPTQKLADGRTLEGQPMPMLLIVKATSFPAESKFRQQLKKLGVDSMQNVVVKFSAYKDDDGKGHDFARLDMSIVRDDKQRAVRISRTADDYRLMRQLYDQYLPLMDLYASKIEAEQDDDSVPPPIVDDLATGSIPIEGKEVIA